MYTMTMSNIVIYYIVILVFLLHITRYSLLITHYSLLITHYSLLITHYSLLITYLIRILMMNVLFFFVVFFSMNKCLIREFLY
jgi:hypothetical protein